MLVRYIAMFAGLLTMSMLYDRYKNKLNIHDEYSDYEVVRQYLLNESSLAKSTKPIMWIHVTYEPNSRHWRNWGSRKTTDLNRPYLHLTMRSIIKNCGDSFQICMIDDRSFVNLIPGWDTRVDKLASPIKEHMRKLAMFYLLKHYGGMIVPPSFACKRDLISMYNEGIATNSNGIFVCETPNSMRNKDHDSADLYPDTGFMGCNKGNEILEQLLQHSQGLNSQDYGGEMDFKGELDEWCFNAVKNGYMNVICASYTGGKTLHDDKVLIDDLMANKPIPLRSDLYGIYIPEQQLMKRLNYGWFVRSSEKQVLASKTHIGKFLLENL